MNQRSCTWSQQEFGESPVSSTHTFYRKASICNGLQLYKYYNLSSSLVVVPEFWCDEEHACLKFHVKKLTCCKIGADVDFFVFCTKVKIEVRVCEYLFKHFVTISSQFILGITVKLICIIQIYLEPDLYRIKQN